MNQKLIKQKKKNSQLKQFLTQPRPLYLSIERTEIRKASELEKTAI
jgi:hypothetical protein